jgi:hypothetical protein
VDARLDLDNAGLNTARVVEASNRSRSIHEELWTDAAAVAELKPTSVTTAYINSLNETIDLHEQRMAAYENRVPLVIWSLITCVSVIAVFTRGLTARSWRPCFGGVFRPSCKRPSFVFVVGCRGEALPCPGRSLYKWDAR